jgi:TolA-binding protein
MTVVGLHPEELFDKLLDGELTPAERERLQQHLDGCSVCRFEYAARQDFRAEALELALASPPPALPLRAPLPPSDLAAPAAAARRRRSRRLVWGLAAAALITASAAVASSMVSASPWHPLGLSFSERGRPGSEPAPMKTPPTMVAKSVLDGRSAVAEAAPAEGVPSVDSPAAAHDAPAVSRRDGAARPRAHAARKVATTAGSPTVLAGVAPSHTEAPSAKEGVAKDAPASKEPTSAAKLFGEANQARRSGDIGRASGLYHLLQDQFPGSPEADLSRVTLALLLLDSGDAQSALSGFERYLAGSSRGLEAEALVGRARALGRLGRRDLETSAWQEVQRKYPRSIYGRQASERLLALGRP